MERTRSAAPALALLVALGACDDPVDGGAHALTEAEAAALAEVVAGTVFWDWQLQSGAVSAPPRASGTDDVHDVLGCELGGSVAVAGSVSFDEDLETGDASYHYIVTHVHDGCAVESVDGVPFTLDGAPDVALDYVIEIEGDDVLLHGNFAGSLDWVTAEKSGSCEVGSSFLIEATGDADTGNASLSGLICGVTFSHDLEIS